VQQTITIVMYHYVRDLRHSRYPEIKGLSTEEFEHQVSYIKKFYTVISGHQLMVAIVDAAPLPSRPLLLTFDDGYKDHFEEVFPILDREKIPACFFPSAKCILEDKVLDVNKIHFVLASVPDKRQLVEYIFSKVESHRSQYDLLAPQVYWEKVGIPNRFDPAEVVFCKRMLQRELPLEFRTALIGELFSQYVSEDEAEFSRELYMSPDQIKALQRHGMYVGSHGYDHFWLSNLSAEQQEREVDQSLGFLASVGVDISTWIMCYPYGAYNDSLLAVLKARNCVVGLTTEVGLASLGLHDPLVLPRINTNDLPKNARAEMGEWTKKALT
jgi:peptidoglycan/xylan/chitin deacetylase (PgdA/CDA1 family)